jgi:hypothetical protein
MDLGVLGWNSRAVDAVDEEGAVQILSYVSFSVAMLFIRLLFMRAIMSKTIINCPPMHLHSSPSQPKLRPKKGKGPTAMIT